MFKGGFTCVKIIHEPWNDLYSYYQVPFPLQCKLLKAQVLRFEFTKHVSFDTKGSSFLGV